MKKKWYKVDINFWVMINGLFFWVQKEYDEIGNIRKLDDDI